MQLSCRLQRASGAALLEMPNSLRERLNRVHQLLFLVFQFFSAQLAHSAHLIASYFVVRVHVAYRYRRCAFAFCSSRICVRARRFFPLPVSDTCVTFS